MNREADEVAEGVKAVPGESSEIIIHYPELSNKWN